jgi:hypothetical protein
MYRKTLDTVEVFLVHRRNSVPFSSWSSNTSGFLACSHITTCSARARSEFTFQLAMSMTSSGISEFLGLVFYCAVSIRALLRMRFLSANFLNVDQM